MRIRKAMGLIEAADAEPSTVTIEADETYIGGKYDSAGSGRDGTNRPCSVAPSNVSTALFSHASVGSVADSPAGKRLTRYCRNICAAAITRPVNRVASRRRHLLV